MTTDQSNESLAATKGLPETQDVARLKRLVAAIKNKSEESIKSIHDQLTQAQEDLEEANQENKAVKEQHLRLRELLTKAQEELKKTRKELADAVNENVRLAQHSRQQKVDSENSLSNESTGQKFQETKQRVDQLERVINFLRDRSEGAQLEAKQLREELEKAYEKIDLLNEQHPSSSTAVDEEKELLKREITSLRESSSKPAIPSSNQSTSDASFELQQLRLEKVKWQEELDRLRLHVDEKESQAKQAQQHLAKKVKETTVLSEKIEEQKIQLLEAQHKLHEAKSKTSELNNILNLQQQQEKRLQDQLNEVLRSFDAQIQKWEEKYFQVYEKLQESEMRNHSLRKLEEKHAQMQNVLASLGTFIAPPPPTGSQQTQSEPRPADATSDIQNPFGMQLNRHPFKPNSIE